MQFSALFIALAAFALSSTDAHVTCNPAVAVPNSYFVTVIRVPHSFAGAVTNNVSVEIPAGVTSVKAKQVGGWKVDLQTTPVNGTDVVSKVTWYGGSLPDELYQDFGLQLKLGNLPIGSSIYFKTVQETTPNGTLAWNSTPDASGKLADPSHPAPKVTIVNSTDNTASSSTNKTSNATAAPAKSSAVVAAIPGVALALAAMLV